MEDNVLKIQKTTTIPNRGKMAITILITTTMAVSLVLAPGGIYQRATAQPAPTPRGTANVVAHIRVINDNGGTKKASDFTVQVASSDPRCRDGTFTVRAVFPGSESGTTTSIPAPGCFFAVITNSGPAYTITSSPCDHVPYQRIQPGQTMTCSWTLNDIG